MFDGVLMATSHFAVGIDEILEIEAQCFQLPTFVGNQGSRAPLRRFYMIGNPPVAY